MTTTNKVNRILGGKRIDPEEFSELKFIYEICGSCVGEELRIKVLNFFLFVQKNETRGWRTRQMTRIIVDFLLNNTKNNPITLYSLLCPSYKKGIGEFGVRTDGVGETTIVGIDRLFYFYEEILRMGFYVEKPLIIFFDLALEQYDKIVMENKLCDLNVNIKNIVSILPTNGVFYKLSDYQYLLDEVGYKGITLDTLPITENLFNRILERGRLFYQLFKWSNKDIYNRTLTVVSSEAVVGKYLKAIIKNGVMLYTPKMLERAYIYSGLDLESNPLPVIFPKNSIESG